MNNSLRQTAVRFLFLLFGVFCCSTAVIMIKAGNEHPLLVASYRLIVAAVVLTPFFLRDLSTVEEKYSWKQVSWSVAPAIFLAIHFITWVIGARMTQVAEASLIINLTPVVMPFLVWGLFRERVNLQEILGTVATLVGLLILTGSNLSLSPDHLLGDLVCLGSMITFAIYLALGRKNGQRLKLWLYMVPLYAIAGVVCLLLALFWVNPIKPYTLQNVLLILGLGFIPTVMGHSILNYSLKSFRGQVVSVTNLTQPVFAGVLGFIFFREVPQPVFFAAAFFILVGVFVTLTAHRQKTPQAAACVAVEK